MSEDLVSSLSSELRQQIESFSPTIELRDIGNVLEAGDGIARVSGLADVRSQELVRFANDVMGIAFNLESDSVGVIVMGEYSGIEEGMAVYSTGRIAAGVVKRKDVDTPVQTGIKAIDSMIPIGRGQRELIIGDRQTGKTALA